MSLDLEEELREVAAFLAGKSLKNMDAEDRSRIRRRSKQYV